MKTYLHSTKTTSLPRQRQPSNVNFDLLLRQAFSFEADRVFDFIKAHPDPNLFPRNLDEIRQLCRNGFVFLLTSGPQEELIGMGCIFEMADCQFELGACLISPQWRGNGYQNILLRIRIAWLVNVYGSNINIAVGIKPKNFWSVRNALNIGFTAWETPTPAFMVTCETCQCKRQAHQPCEYQFYKLPTHTMQLIALSFAELPTASVTLNYQIAPALQKELSVQASNSSPQPRLLCRR